MRFLQTQLKQCDFQCLRLLACGTISLGEQLPAACLTKQHHIPSDLKLQRHQCRPIKSCSALVLFFSHLMTQSPILTLWITKKHMVGWLWRIQKLSSFIWRNRLRGLQYASVKFELGISAIHNTAVKWSVTSTKNRCNQEYRKTHFTSVSLVVTVWFTDVNCSRVSRSDTAPDFICSS